MPRFVVVTRRMLPRAHLPVLQDLYPGGADVTYDVIVIGEPLLEFSASDPLATASEFRLSFSGDALNAAVAAAAAGAKTALLTRLGRDELSDRLVAFLAKHGVDTSLVRREEGQTTQAFAYLRAGSAATRLQPSDVNEAGVARARAVLLGGVTAALSPSCAATVLHAARLVHASELPRPADHTP